jgi:hypothetical protein
VEILRGIATTVRFPLPGADPISFEEKPPTVTATRDSTGAAVELPAPTEKSEGGETFWELTFSPTVTMQVDILHLTWTDKKAGGNVYRQDVEIVGGFIVGVQEIKAKVGGNPTTHKVEIARAMASQDIEAACGMAFRPRYRKDQLSGKGRSRLRVNRRELLEVLRVSVEGVDLTTGEIEALRLDSNGVLEITGSWPKGRSNVEVAYIYGYSALLSARQPVKDYAAYLLTENPSDWQGRATSFTNEFGSTYQLVTPGVRGARFPIPSVNAFVEGFNEPLVA